MNAKQVKKINRMIRGEEVKMIVSYIQSLKDRPFFERVKFCWYILRG
jgi:hypothetical protein